MTPITALTLVPWLIYFSHWPLQPLGDMQAASLAPLLWVVITDIRAAIKDWLTYREGRASRGPVDQAIELARKGKS